MDAVKEKKGTMDLTEGSSFKKIIVFSIPLIIGNIFQLFYSWADAIVIGKTDGAVAYGSITASMPVIFLILTVTNGFLTGAVVILSQLFSKKDEVGIKKSLNTILITMLVASLLVTVIGYFGTKPLLKLLKVSPEQIEGTTAYLQIYFLGSIAVVMYNTFNMILKSVGNSAAPLVILISSTVLNLGLDILFVAVFHMGVVGVAVATLIAQFLSAVLAFVYMQIKIPILRVRLKDFRFSGEYFKSINKAAIPSLIQQLVTSSGFLVVNMLVNGHGAELTIAYGLGNRIDEIMNMEIQSFGTTLSTFAAQNKGAGKTERIKKGFWQTLLITFVTTVILGRTCADFQTRHSFAVHLSRQQRDGRHKRRYTERYRHNGYVHLHYGAVVFCSCSHAPNHAAFERRGRHGNRHECKHFQFCGKNHSRFCSQPFLRLRGSVCRVRHGMVRRHDLGVGKIFRKQMAEQRLILQSKIPAVTVFRRGELPYCCRDKS